MNSLVYRTIKRLVDALPSWALRFRPFAIYEISLQELGIGECVPASPPRGRRDDPPCEFRWVATQPEVANLRRLANPADVDRLDGTTRRAAAAWRDGELVGCVWVAAESFEEEDLRLRFELGADEAWLFAASVAPPWRRRGIYRRLLEFVVGELAREHRRRLLLGVTVGNQASQRAHERQGAMRVGSIAAGRCLGFSACCRTGDVRRLSRWPLTWRQATRLAVDRR